MRDVIGVVVRRSSITAALVRRNAIAWSAERSLQGDDDREQVLRELLTAAPGKGRRKRRLGVIVEPPVAQVRRLEGIPTLTDPLTARLVRENASAFFLKRESGVVITSVCRSEGAVWGAALDGDLVRDITMVADSLRFDLRGVAASSEFLHADGAIAAADLNRRSPLVWTREAVRHETRRFRAMTAATLGIAMLASTAPILRTLLDETRMRRELKGTQSIEADARRAFGELRRLSGRLEERASFDSSRGQVTRLLARMGDALPDSTALLSLRVDSLEVSLVTFSPRVTDVLPALGGVSQSVRIIGPVSHELLDGKRLERATFRLLRPVKRLR